MPPSMALAFLAALGIAVALPAELGWFFSEESAVPSDSVGVADITGSPMMISNGFLEPYHEHGNSKRNMQGTTPLPAGKRDGTVQEDEFSEN